MTVKEMRINVSRTLADADRCWKNAEKYESIFYKIAQCGFHTPEEVFVAQLACNIVGAEIVTRRMQRDLSDMELNQEKEEDNK